MAGHEDRHRVSTDRGTDRPHRGRRADTAREFRVADRRAPGDVEQRPPDRDLEACAGETDRNLERLAARAMMGLARTGSSASNGSGDYALAFSTAESVRRPWNATSLTTTELANEEMSALFQAVVEAVEEAIYNSMFAASTVTGNGRTIDAIPLDRVREVLRKYGLPAR
jgi:hypothetical protein